MARPAANSSNDTATTSGASRRTFRVLIGCDWGEGYRPAGTIVDNVPAKIAAVWLADTPPVLEAIDGES